MENAIYNNTMTVSPPSASVIVPIYKVERYLEQCVDSVLAQTLREIEVILVDDGSPDGCPAMCDAYAARDSRVRVIHQENQGAGAARNMGLSVAQGAYVIFLDADDIYHPQMLERMVARAEKYCADVVICLAEAFEEETGRSRSMPNQLRRELLKGVDANAFCPRSEQPQQLFQLCAGWPWDKLYRREFVLQSGLQFQNLPHTNDAFFVYLSLVQAAVVSVEPAVLVQHRMHGASISHNTGRSTTSLADALLAIHEQVLAQGNTQLARSFHHWAMNMAVWHYMQLAGPAAEMFRDCLRREVEPALQLLQKGAGYYPRKRDWERYKVCVAPEISVVLPIYNAAAYLRPALDSLLAQSLSDWEAICVNDGSTDNSLEILREYAAMDRRFRILDGPNGGYGKAMNRGMDAAAGKYIAILEPDDELPRHAYRHLYASGETYRVCTSA